MCRLVWIAIVAEDTLRGRNSWLSWNVLCLSAHDAAGGLEMCLLHTTQHVVAIYGFLRIRLIAMFVLYMCFSTRLYKLHNCAQATVSACRLCQTRVRGRLTTLHGRLKCSFFLNNLYCTFT